MTPQEVFDKVAGHLLRQRVKSLRPAGHCAYRGADGLMCAAGCLIKDEHYKPALEGHTTTREEVAAALVASGVPEGEGIFDWGGLLYELQQLHDARKVSYWPKGLALLARRHNLTFPTTDQEIAEKYGVDTWWLQ